MQNDKINIIVTADDFGYCNDVSNEIIKFVDQSIVTSVSCIVTSPFFSKNAEKLRPFLNEISIGCHIDLSEFNKSSLPCFYDVLIPFRYYKKLKAISLEIEDQIDILYKTYGRVDYFDSHHHIHTSTLLFPLFVFFKIKNLPLRFRSTRFLPYRLKSQYFNYNFFKHFFKYIWRYFYFLFTPFKSTDWFFRAIDFIDHSNYKELLGSTVELMVHPGSNDPEFKKELLMLPQVLSSSDVNLINYTNV